METIAAHRRELPSLGQPGPPRRGVGVFREIAPGHRVPTTRIFLTLPVSGEPEVLGWWPDKADSELNVSNQAFIDRIGGYDELQKQPDDVAKEYYSTLDIWVLDDVSLGASSVGLITYADLTQDEIEAAVSDNSLRDLFDSRRSEAEAIVAAIRDQMINFYEKELPAELVARAEANRRRLESINALYNTLGLPASWKTPEPKIVPTPEPVSPVQGLAVRPRWRLEPVSYEDILGIIRLWSNAVETYPNAFRGLVEDRVSDLLAATLNATTSGAGREVYSRGGKTDIAIRADVLGEANGPASIFICEAKWVAGNDDVTSAIEDQLMRYVPVAATSTVFLALSKNTDFLGAVDSIRGWARRVPGYLRERESSVEGWPIFTFELPDIDGVEMDVAIATVNVGPVPRTRRQRNENKTV